MDQEQHEVNGGGISHVHPLNLNGSPLHVAVSREDLDLVKHLYVSRPELAHATDSRRRLPLHLASARGFTEIATMLISDDDLDMCTARDVDGRTPLHLAAMNGRVEILKMLVDKCPPAAEARADRGETILHLCFKYNHHDCLTHMLTMPIMQKHINKKDDDGNTLLHLATAKEDPTGADNEVWSCLLRCPGINLNATNCHMHSPLDIALALQRRYEKKEEALLIHEKKREALLEDVAIDISIKYSTPLVWKRVDSLRKEGAKIGVDRGIQEWLGKRRDSLMVVASLIATMAFQAAVSPPGGVWQDSADGHRAGETVMAYTHPDSFPHFIRLNTVGFVAALTTILLLTIEFPIKARNLLRLLVVTMSVTVVTMSLTYSYAITAVAPKKDEGSVTRPLRTGLIVWIGVMFVPVVLQSVRSIGLIVKDKIAEKRMKDRELRLSTFATKEHAHNQP